MTRLASGPEFDLIRAIAQQATLKHPDVRVGPGDDCALIGDIAISVDASVEGVHFRRDWLTAEEIGWRAAAAALSDLAAVAAQPIGILITAVVPAGDRGEFIQSVMRGAIAASEAAGAMLLGGDVSAGETLMLDVVAVGRAAQPVLRSGARPGDQLWVTGTLGGAAAAVAAWQSGNAPAAAARVRYARAVPRIAAARWLHEQARLSAMIDISDGLYGDVAHLAAASGCSFTIDSDKIPIDQEAGASFAQAVSGGEDYELCFTAAADAIAAVRTRFEEEFGIPLTQVGVAAVGAGVVERAADGSTRAVQQAGYQHFKENAL